MALVMQELQEMDTHRLVHQPAVPLELGMVATFGSKYNGEKPLRPGVRSLLVKGILGKWRLIINLCTPKGSNMNAT